MFAGRDEILVFLVNLLVLNKLQTNFQIELIKQKYVISLFFPKYLYDILKHYHE